MAVGQPTGLAGAVQYIAPAGARLVTAAQAHVKYSGRIEPPHAEHRARVGDVAQGGEIGGQLELNALLEQQQIDLLRAGLVINHRAKRFVALRVHG